jgi:N-acetylmuramoyl-L-alanine amidase
MRGAAAKWLRKFLHAAALLGLAAGASAAEIRAVKLVAESDHVRAVFETSAPLDYKLFEIGNPDRIVLDVHDANFAQTFAAPAGAGWLKSIRTGRIGKDGVRVVFDLAGAARPKSFLQPPDDGAGFRLIVDLYKKGHSPAALKSVSALAAKPRDVVIAIDAGHGGVDPGATGNGGTREKDITLAVARDLQRLVDAQPGMRAVLTRDGDYFIALKDRYRKAREAKADLFVSVHADAFASEDARGSSVWMLSTRGASSEAAHWLADRENRADLVGGVTLDNKDNTLAAVLLDLSQSATLEASGAVAKRVLHALAQIGPTHRGYVEKANFVVLRSPDVPSILVETAFITNPTEEKRLTSNVQREKLAVAILDGMREYFRSTPPPGTWFATNAHKDKPRVVAVLQPDDPDAAELGGTVAERGPSS